MTVRGLLIVVGLAVGLALWIAWAVPIAVPPLQADLGLLEVRMEEREMRLGRALSQKEREQMRERFRDEELLLAYAREEGLDRLPYVERRLLRKMRFLLSGRLRTPSDGELRAIYDANPKRFLSIGSDKPLPFERVKEQLRAMLATPAARAAIAERVGTLVDRYHLVIQD